MATEAHDAAPAWHATGMPQLDITTWANQIFWLAVALVVIFLVLWRVALPRIGAVLAERRGTITNDLAAAEELKQKAVAAEKAYNDALAAARAEAGRHPQRRRVLVREHGLQFGRLIDEDLGLGQQRAPVFVELQAPADAVKQFDAQRGLEIGQRGAGR